MDNNVLDTVNNGITLADKIADIAKGLFGSSNYKKDEKTRNEGLQETIEKVKNSDLAMLYDANGIKIISPKLEELYKNAGKRMICHEIIKENNIETVFEGAQALLEEDKKAGIDCSSESYVDKDFINQFFDIVGDVSNEDMQRVWTKLLAGEIKNPGKFSLRTLQKLKTISSDEAKLFERIAPYVIDQNYIPNDADFLHKFGVEYSELMILQDCEVLSLVKTKKYYKSQQAAIYNNKISVFKKKFAIGDEKNEIEARTFPLSKFGKELLKIVNVKYNDDYFYEYLNKLKSYQKDSNNIEVSCYEINNYYDDKIEYISNEDLLKKYNEKIKAKQLRYILEKAKKVKK